MCFDALISDPSAVVIHDLIMVCVATALFACQKA